MRIGILTTIKDGIGGVERFTTYLERGLIQRGYEVMVIDRNSLGIFARATVSISKYIGAQPVVLGYWLSISAMRSNCDVVITNGLLGWYAAPIESKRLRVINVQHGTYARAAERIDRNRNWMKYFIKRHIWGFFEGYAARNASVCVAVSHETTHSISEYYRVNNVLVIHNAVNTDFFTPMNSVSKKSQAIFVGRFEYAKGQVILESLKHYLEKQGWQLVIAEQLTQDELRIAYNESQVFLLPSLHEGCSYALLEAMACGVPFLASPVGLVTDFALQGIFSECIVQEQTAEAYISAFQRLVGLEKESLEALSRKLREYVIDNHSITTAIDQYENILKS